MFKTEFKIFLLVILLLVMIALLSFMPNNSNVQEDQDANSTPSPLSENTPEEDLKVAKACFGDFCFILELATTTEQRTLGLMNRSSLPDNTGMLFVFEEPNTYSFWMKNTLIPLDIIWLDETSRVIFIKRNAQPCHADICHSIIPPQKALYVLEVNSGKIAEIGMKIGDLIELKGF